VKNYGEVCEIIDIGKHKIEKGKYIISVTHE